MKEAIEFHLPTKEIHLLRRDFDTCFYVWVSPEEKEVRLLFFRNLDVHRLILNFNEFPPDKFGSTPDFTKPRILDQGQTIMFGSDYEIALKELQLNSLDGVEDL